MKLNKQIAEGITINAKDFDYVVAVRKPNANTQIIREFWFKGNVADLKKLMENKDER